MRSITIFCVLGVILPLYGIRQNESEHRSFFFLLLLSFFLFRNPTGHQTRLINGRKALATTFLVPLYRRGDTSQSVAVSGWYTTCGDGVQGIHEPRTVACSICCIVGHHEAGSFGLLARASCKSWSFKNTGANGPSVYT